MSLIFTVSEAAERIGCNPWTLRRAARRLSEPLPRRGGKRAVPVDRLEELAAEVGAQQHRRRGPTRKPYGA